MSSPPALALPGVLLIGTSSRHKAEEIRAIFAACGLGALALQTLADLPAVPPEPHEDGGSFEANAALKAAAYARASGLWTLADDSGLCVDALGGAPGVDSAYYGGLPRSDAKNNDRLLAELAGVPDARRTARFVCVMQVARPDGTIVASARGEVQGRIRHALCGANGFGYDPLFDLTEASGVPDPSWIGRTTAELPADAKNAVSHRGRAARALAAQLTPLPHRG